LLNLLVTFSVSMYIMCHIILVQHFGPQGRRFRNIHYYGISIVQVEWVQLSSSSCVCALHSISYSISHSISHSISQCCLWNSSTAGLISAVELFGSLKALYIFPALIIDGVPFFSFKEDHWALPLSVPLSSWQAVGWCPWLCAHMECLKLLNTCYLLILKALVMVVLPASLFAQSFHLTPACAGQYIYRSLRRLMSNIASQGLSKIFITEVKSSERESC